MARRRKHRTHKKAEDSGSGDGTPKSFIIKHGQVGSSLTQLVRDVRKVMEPNTASRLRVGHTYPIFLCHIFSEMPDQTGASLLLGAHSE
jgi:hypothetical protein